MQQKHTMLNRLIPALNFLQFPSLSLPRNPIAYVHDKGLRIAVSNKRQFCSFSNLHNSITRPWKFANDPGLFKESQTGSNLQGGEYLPTARSLESTLP